MNNITEKIDKEEILDGFNKQFYVYGVAVDLDPNQTMDTVLKISEDADFVIDKISITVYQQSNTELKIMDTQTSRDWVNDFTPIFNFANYNLTDTGIVCFKPHKPIKLNKGTSIKISVRNTSNLTNWLRIAFIGYKIFKL
jgi:hypothetical protein